MTTDEMKALPIGTRVFSETTGHEFEKVAEMKNDVYRCSFRRVTSRGLSSRTTHFHGARIRLTSEPQ